MHQVFENSYLTIVVANTSGSEQGFLEVYDDQSTVISLPLRLEGGRIGNILLSQKGTELNQEPPHEKAWMLPETVLAPRLLVYRRKCILEMRQRRRRRCKLYERSVLLLTERLFVLSSACNPLICFRLTTFNKWSGSRSTSGLGSWSRRTIRVDDYESYG